MSVLDEGCSKMALIEEWVGYSIHKHGDLLKLAGFEIYIFTYIITHDFWKIEDIKRGIRSRNSMNDLQS